MMNGKWIRFLFSLIIFFAAVYGHQFLYRFGAAGFILPGDGVRWLSHLRGLLLILAGSIGLPLLAEWLAFGLSKWLEKDPLKVQSFSLRWLRGLLLFLVVTYSCAVALIAAGRSDSDFAPIFAAAGLMLLLLVLRKPFQWIILGSMKTEIKPGPGRFIGSGIALVWNLMGFWLAGMHEQASYFSAGGLVLVGFGFAVPVAVGYILFGLLEWRLARSDNPIAQWNISGSILYLSWFCFGFIARLTPTTLGQPERWVGIPSPPTAPPEA